MLPRLVRFDYNRAMRRQDRRDVVLGLLGRFTPLRSARIRRMLRVGRRRWQRFRRLRAERRGDDRFSRPALHDMERKLRRHLPDRGFFVEAGAYDGYVQSNTYWLERFGGWRGLLVEPIPELHREAVRERPASRVVNCALVPPDKSGQPVRMRYAGTMSIVAGARGDDLTDDAYLESAFAIPERHYSVEVPGRTLTELLDEMEAPEVDILSLDMEGYEPQALRGLDLARRPPRFILVEVTSPSALRAVEGVLGDRYRLAEWLSPTDALFTRS
jgi:FkbM family methyltransferase